MPSSWELLVSRAGRNVARWAHQPAMSRESREGIDRGAVERQMTSSRATIIGVYRELGLLYVSADGTWRVYPFRSATSARATVATPGETADAPGPATQDAGRP